MLLLKLVLPFMQLVLLKNGTNEVTEISDLHKKFCQGSILIFQNLNTKKIALGVGRNLEDFDLSPGIIKAQRLAIENAAKEVFKKLNNRLGGTYHPLLGINEDVRKQMVVDHFLFMSGEKNIQVSAYIFIYQRYQFQINVVERKVSKYVLPNASRGEMGRL